MTRQKIIIDTDPGQDDALAILLALASPELDLLGLTVVAGNAPLAMTQANARKVCELAGRRDIRVFAGADRPLVRDLHTAPEVHGATGLNGPDLPPPTMPLETQHAVDFLIDTVMSAEPGSITLVPVGPLTNVAQAMLREPRLASRLQRIVLMGGAQREGGNSSPVAEFNIYVDPHAADIVFRSGVELVVFSLDVTHQVLTSQARMDRLAGLNTRVARASHQMLDFYRQYDQQKYGTDGGPLHDPCPIAWLIRPDLFQGRPAQVAIETDSPLTFGQTVVDYFGRGGRRPNALWMKTADSDGFFDLLIERLAIL